MSGAEAKYHVFGDSHSHWMCRPLADRFSIHYVGPQIAYNLGTNRSTWWHALRKDRINVFMYGEIDVRWHISTQFWHDREAAVKRVMRNYLGTVDTAQEAGYKVCIVDPPPPVIAGVENYARREEATTLFADTLKQFCYFYDVDYVSVLPRWREMRARLGIKCCADEWHFNTSGGLVLWDALEERYQC